MHVIRHHDKCTQFHVREVLWYLPPACLSRVSCPEEPHLTPDDSPKKPYRPWVTIVRKYAPGWA